MTKYPMRIALTVVLAAAAAYGAASLPDDDSGGRRSADARFADISAKKPPVIMIVMDEFPVDALLGPDGNIDAGRFPNFAELARNGHLVPQRLHRLRLHHQGDPRHPRRQAAPQGHAADLHRPPALGVRPLRPPRLPHRELGGGHLRCARRATAATRRPSRPAILPFLQEGRRERLQSFFARVRPGPATFYLKHVLLPHGPYLFLPVGQAEPRQLARPAAVDEQHPGLLRRLPHAAQPAAACCCRSASWTTSWAGCSTACAG